MASPRTSRQQIEWPTVGVAVSVYVLWLVALFSHHLVPWFVTITLLAVSITWHGSLQHETIHDHPFKGRKWNSLVGYLPLSLRLPYSVYRRYHLAHHACVELTDPTDDSESFYVTAANWGKMGRVRRSFIMVHHTLLGRMIFGPLRENYKVATHQTQAIWRGDRELARWWGIHAIMATGVSLLVLHLTGIPFWQYVVGAVYLGHSLTLLRSYCEHRWEENETRSAIVRAGLFFSLLFLNNNLHHVHHANPGVPWYKLKKLSEDTNAEQEASMGAGLYSSYYQVFKRFLVKPYTHPVHPTL